MFVVNLNSKLIIFHKTNISIPMPDTSIPHSANTSEDDKLIVD